MFLNEIQVEEQELSAALADRLLRDVDEELILRDMRGLTVCAAKPVTTGPNHKQAVAAVLRVAQLQSVGNWIRKQAEERLTQLEEELVSEVKRNDPTMGTAAERRKALTKLFVAADKRITNAFAWLGGKVQGYFAELAKAIAAKVHKNVKEHHGVEPSAPDLSGVLETPVLGATLAEHFKKMGEDAAFRFKAAVRQSLKAEEPLSWLLERVVGGGEPVKAADPGLARKQLEISVRLMDAAENSVNKVIQAAITAFSNEAESAVAEGIGEERNMGWTWVAVMDAATCPQCEFLDGNRWTAEYEPVEDAPEFPDEPPLHFNCRCSLVPTDLDEEPVPEQDFDDYLSQFTRAEQESAFGKFNLRAYRRGDITANQLIGQQDNVMSLEEFRKERLGS